jgi:hypothetical protein
MLRLYFMRGFYVECISDVIARNKRTRNIVYTFSELRFEVDTATNKWRVVLIELMKFEDPWHVASLDSWLERLLYSEAWCNVWVPVYRRFRRTNCYYYKSSFITLRCRQYVLQKHIYSRTRPHVVTCPGNINHGGHRRDSLKSCAVE